MSEKPSEPSQPNQPYRDSDKEPLRDTGRMPKFSDEGKHMSNARVFDTLVESNVALVKSNASLVSVFKLAVIMMFAFVIISAGASIFSAYVLRQGQQETRDLIIAFSKKDCSDAVTSKKGTR